MYIQSKVIHEGSKNCSVQITGWGPFSWTIVADVAGMPQRRIELRLDAVHYAISEKTEVQLGWTNAHGVVPFLPLGGRGKLDFSEVSGLHNMAEGRTGSIELQCLGEGLFTVILDLSKHEGALP